MSKQLKYQELIDETAANGKCPFDGCDHKELPGFRWSFEDTSIDEIYLPTSLVDKVKNIPRRINSELDYCKSCGLSLFISYDAAKKRWKRIPQRTKEKMGFTHVLQLNITAEIGVASNSDDDGHFTFFEYAECVNREMYQMVGTL
jgi:hypothetical protein